MLLVVIVQRPTKARPGSERITLLAEADQQRSGTIMGGGYDPRRLSSMIGLGYYASLVPDRVTRVKRTFNRPGGTSRQATTVYPTVGENVAVAAIAAKQGLSSVTWCAPDGGTVASENESK